jgi:hypothetical protein
VFGGLCAFDAFSIYPIQFIMALWGQDPIVNRGVSADGIPMAKRGKLSYPRSHSLSGIELGLNWFDVTP